MTHSCKRCDSIDSGVTIQVEAGPFREGPLNLGYCAECLIELLDLVAKHANELNQLSRIRSDVDFGDG